MMKMRPNSSDPITVQGYKQPLMRSRRRKLFGIGCGHWLFGMLMMFLTVVCLCGASMIYYVGNPPEQINILVIGVDARSEQDNLIARTDSLMVMSVDAHNERVTLFSIPRDVQILSPNYGRLPINVIARNAELDSPDTGVPELIDSIELEFGIKIHHYVRMDFDAFVEVVDAAGGVEIDVPKSIVDYDYPTADGGTMTVSFAAGEQEMDGETALIYARTRHSDDDYNRASRQQQVMQGVVDKLRNPLNAWRVPGVLAALISNTSSDMQAGEYFQVTPGLILYGRPGYLTQFVLTREYLSAGDSGPTPNHDVLDPWIDENLK